MENTLIESKNNYIGVVKKIMLITFIIAIVSFILGQASQSKGTEYWRKAFDVIYSYNSSDKELYEKYSQKASTFYDLATIGTGTGIICAVIFVFSLGIFLYARKMKIIVTDKRVYGQASFGKQVDLPFDSISAIGKGFLKGIVVATSSGKIRFILVSNRDDIYKTISNLLITRQDKKQVVNNTSTTEELKKYKELLDSGIITQEEFNAKKKQLLNL